MNRRNFMGGLIAGMVLVEASASLTLEAQPLAESHSTWLGTEPLIFVGEWDVETSFLRRLGGNATWWEEQYRKDHTEETVRELKTLGVTLAILHFYKGLGLAMESEHIADARRLAALLKAYGIRVGLYVGSTLFYETFLIEKPEAEAWLVPDYLGQPVYYGGLQTFRRRVYFMHPGYREYIKRVLQLGVEDLKADLFHFDNTSNQAVPAIFHHPLAIEDFRKYLTEKYSADYLKKRFGFSDLRYVVPPKYDRPLTIIDDPLFQEWADFRCHQLNSYYKEMADFIHSLNPEVVVAINPSSGISGRNTVWYQGVDYPSLLAPLDLAWTEEGDFAGVTPEGILVSKIRTYKMASTLNKRILTFTAGNSEFLVEGVGKLAIAESLAFNRQTFGMVGGMNAAQVLPEDQKKYIRFFRQHFDLYRGVASRADVALLYSRATMAFNNERPAVSFMLLGQILIQANIPFDIIFDEQLKDLSKYRVLVLADQECLDDEKMSLIRGFVSEGGGLVATEHTSLYTEWRLRRMDFGLKDLFRVEAPPYMGQGNPELLLQGGPVRNQVGKGRAVYFPEVKPAIEKPPAEPMRSQYWKLPLNWEELATAIRWTAGGMLSLEVKAPATLNVVAEVTKQKEKDKLLLHLVNYGVAKTPEVKGIEVEVEMPAGKKANRVTVLTPDRATEAALSYSAAPDRIRFTVPALETYNLVVIQLS